MASLASRGVTFLMFTAYEEINVGASVKLSKTFFVGLGAASSALITVYDNLFLSHCTFFIIFLFCFYLGGQSFDHQCSSWQSSCTVATQVRLKCGWEMCSTCEPNGPNSSDRGSLRGEQWVRTKAAEAEHFRRIRKQLLHHHFPCCDVLSRNLFGIVLEKKWSRAVKKRQGHFLLRIEKTLAPFKITYGVGSKKITIAFTFSRDFFRGIFYHCET